MLCGWGRRAAALFLIVTLRHTVDKYFVFLFCFVFLSVLFSFVCLFVVFVCLFSFFGCLVLLTHFLILRRKKMINKVHFNVRKSLSLSLSLSQFNSHLLYWHECYENYVAKASRIN